MSGPPRVLRILGRVMPALVGAALFILPAALFATGALLWRDRHALAREGVPFQASIERCRWESMHRQKIMVGRGSGYYSCHYLYQPIAAGPIYAGYFQDSREWTPGEPISIRYRGDQPSTSATEKDVAHPSIAPGAMMLLPLLYAAWQARGPLRRRLRGR